MKHVFIISLATAFCIVACSNDHLELKARPNKGAPQKTTNKTDADSTSDGSDGILNMPTNTTNRKIPANGSAARHILIGNEEMTTTVFCSKNLVKAQKEKENIKLQGKSQIIVRQVTKLMPPEEDGSRLSKNKTPKTLVSLTCGGDSEDLRKEAADPQITLTPLVTGKSAVVVGKFTSLPQDLESEALILCVSAADMAKANEVLLPEDKEKAVDILMAVNSKMLVETSSRDKDLKKQILVTCSESP